MKRVIYGLDLPRVSSDGETNEWWDYDRCYQNMDAPEFMPAGGTQGANPCCQAKTISFYREQS